MQMWKCGVCLTLALGSIGAAQAQSPVGTDRLFLSFAEDATIANRQWWEAQFEYADGSDDLPWDRSTLRGVIAINLIKNLEVGGRVGFGSTSAPEPIPDGSGATDLDLWGKWSFGNYQNTAFAAGAILSIPTGDETSGLGTDSFSVKAFGSLRHKLEKAIVTANVGVRTNEDGRVGDPDEDNLDGKTSASLGLGIIIPFSQQVSFVGELGLETERFDNLDSDTRLLAGVNWTPSKRGIFRGATGFGLTDGSPDFTLLLGYAYTF